MSTVRALWRGELPLAEAFWSWAVTIGLIVNLATSLLLVLMLMLDQPWIGLVLGYGLSLPYNLIAVVGVWRSAARYAGPVLHADLARGATLILMVALCLT